MPPTVRRSYKASFKLEVIAYAEEHGNRAAGRKFGISEKLPRDWRKQKPKLNEMKKSKKADRGCKPRWAQLEDVLEDWILTQRAACRGVSTTQIRLKAMSTAKELNIDGFSGGPSWCARFLLRKHLSIRARTTMCQKLPADAQEKLVSFREYMCQSVDTHSVADTHIINMDEVPLTFDIPMSKTVEQTGSKAVTIQTTGHEKASFTVVLACCASGDKLPPMVIFKRKTAIKEKMPPGIVVSNNEKGWMDQAQMLHWIDACYRRRPDGFFKTRKSILVMDSMRAHITDTSKEAIRANNSLPAVIPGGLTKLLQPLDISVNRGFKLVLRELWEEWMTAGEHSFTKTGRMRRATYADVCQWVVTAWQRVPPTNIINGFRKAEIVPALPEDETDMDTSTDDQQSFLTPELAALFNSDTEDEDFEGFIASD